jgi:ubiquitin-conjugating enzyme E2 O
MQQAWRMMFGGSQSTSTGTKDTVIESKHTVYAIAWLALNQMVNRLTLFICGVDPYNSQLDPAEAEKKARPDRFWTVLDFHKLSLIRGKSDVEMRVGDRVKLKDPNGQPATAHGSENEDVGIVYLQSYEVVETVTMLDVLWQDGVKETVRSTELIPYVSPDEYDCW